MAQRKGRNEMIRCTSPPASLLKNPQLNYSMNTGPFLAFLDSLKRYKLQLLGKT